MYAFNLEPQIPSDFATRRPLQVHQPKRAVPSTLIIERVAARDGDLASERIVESASKLLTVLNETFGITLTVPRMNSFRRLKPSFFAHPRLGFIVNARLD